MASPICDAALEPSQVMVIRNSFWEMRTDDLDPQIHRRGRALSDSWLQGNAKAEVASEISTEDEHQSWATVSSDSELSVDESSSVVGSEDGAERWADSASDSEEQRKCLESCAGVVGRPGTWAPAQAIPIVPMQVEEVEVLSDDEEIDMPHAPDRMLVRGVSGCPPGLWLQGRPMCVMVPVQLKPEVAPEFIHSRRRGVRGGRRKNKTNKAQAS